MREEAGCIHTVGVVSFKTDKPNTLFIGSALSRRQCRKGGAGSVTSRLSRGEGIYKTWQSLRSAPAEACQVGSVSSAPAGCTPDWI